MLPPGKSPLGLPPGPTYLKLPPHNPSIITEPNGQLAWVFKKGGQLSTLRRIIKASRGTILQD